MSSVCVLTPIVIGSWPMISVAIMGAASSMGFSVLSSGLELDRRGVGMNRIETEVPNSQVMKEVMAAGQKIQIERQGVKIQFGRDVRGACTVCVTGENHTKAELERIGKEVAGRVVQQFAYHKLITELKKRNYSVVEESIQNDESIQVRVRLGV